jgi:hypothetical protein
MAAQTITTNVLEKEDVAKKAGDGHKIGGGGWEDIHTKILRPTYNDTRTRTADMPLALPQLEVEAEPYKLLDRDGKVLADGYKTTCDPRRINVLKVKGQDLVIADHVSIGFGEIKWKAGEGWPIYTVPDPKHDFSIGMAWNAYVHAILIGCQHADKSITFTVPFAAPGVYTLGPGKVVAFVNDGATDYADNRGFFDVLVFGWT